MQQAFGMRNSNKIEMELSVVVYAFHRFKFVPCSATDTTEMMPWPQKTKAARIPSGVLRTSWRQRLLQRPTSVPSLGLRVCDVMCSGFFLCSQGNTKTKKTELPWHLPCCVLV